MNKDGKYFAWNAKVSDKGQIVIPKEAREVFKINEGDNLLLLGDITRGIAIVKPSDYASLAKQVLNLGDNVGDKD